MEHYSVIGKSLEELLADLDSQRLQGSVGGGSYELAHIAAVIKVAQANEAAAKTTAHWARVASVASIASVIVAVAAVVVAATSGG